jgi:hypothetical protein
MMERSRRTTALAPLTGILFVVLTFVSLVIAGEPPDSDASAEEAVEFWVDNDTAVMVGTVVEALGAVALIFFAASLRRSLHRGDAATGLLSTAAFGGGIVAAAGIGVDATLRFAAADLAGDVDPTVIQTLNGLWGNFFFPMVIGLATLILATSLAALQTHVIPLWLAIVGLVIAVAMFTPAGLVAFLVGGLWVIVLSVMLWRRESTATTPTMVSPAGSTR